ncbi:hypothetical protein DMC30DRAFT_415711 [Rhodotorula diobovata]|uniref:Uncharacterized protein n=1 Tax=Rhodotorula diobovata TaxID=5288 RepID=A0A5C5FXZ6_9BASI|nr:hypothetical protein DMC30DRAFT_415711 [Rhodotorula diobovata]
MRLSDTSYVPTLRQALYALVAVSSAVLALLSTTLLAYQLRWTIGYNKPVPALLVELVSLAVFTLFTLACLSRLHTSTPGLLSSCGGYFVCSALQGCYSLAWM